MTASDDFINGPIGEFGVTLARTPVTVTTDNSSGQKTYSDGSTNNIVCVVANPKDNFALDKSGLTEIGDLFIYAKSTTTINKYDKIAFNSKTYRVNTVNVRKFDGTVAFKKVALFLIA